MCNFSDEAKMQFEKVSSKDFDIFEFKTKTKNYELIALTTMLLTKHNIFEHFKIVPDIWL